MYAVRRSAGQHVAGNAYTVGAARLHRARVAMAVYRQRDRVANRHIAADRASDGDWCRTGRFRAIDGGDGIDGDDRRGDDVDGAGSDIADCPLGVGCGKMECCQRVGGAGIGNEHQVRPVAASADDFARIYRRLAVGEIKRAVARQIDDGEGADRSGAVGCRQMQ